MHPPYPTFDFHLRARIDDYPLDYVARVDISGIVHSCKAVIFDLPQNVQKMMLYDRDKQFQNKIIVRGQLFQVVTGMMTPPILLTHGVLYQG